MNNISDLLNTLDTGDLLLFNGQHFWFSSLIEYFTGSPWSHVGLVLKDPTYIDPKLSGIYLWESGEETIPDAEDNKVKFGVQIVPLEEKLKTYDGRICYRKLKNYNNLTDFHSVDEWKNKLETVFKNIYNKTYDYNPIDLILCGLGICVKELNDRKSNSFFCSAMVSYVYTELGILDKNTNWSIISPKDYALPMPYNELITRDNTTTNDKLQFINNYWLDDIVKIII